MMKRWFAALMILCLMLSCAWAQGEEMLASYVLPDEAQVYYLPMGEKPEAPEGLEAMYALMQPHSYKGDLYLLCMKNGTVLLSVSGMLAERELSAEELTALWPRAAADLRLLPGVKSVNADPACAQVKAMGGIDLLHVKTQLECDAETGVTNLTAECYAFCDGIGVTELWAVYPDPKDPAHAEMAEALQADLADLEELLSTLSFPSGDSNVLQAVPYVDGKSRFAMAAPVDCVELTQQTSPEDVEALRQSFIEKNPEGANRVFDRFLRQLSQVDSVLLFTPDMQGIIKITATPEQCLAGVEAKGLASLAPALQATLAMDYDVAALMESDQFVTVSSLEHALMGYWLRMGELDQQLDIMICIHPENWMYEIDLFTAEGNQQLRSELHAFVKQTLVYTPPVNALD